MKLLLLSNSTNYGEKYMQWCDNIIAFFLKDNKENIVFVPYAAVGFTNDEYTTKVNNALAEYSIRVKGIHTFENKKKAIEEASAILVGGGNTFHLLKTLQELDLVSLLHELVAKDTPYVGWSAGSNIASPTICTTNDMPIVEPLSFKALNLVPYQINPHYTESTLNGHGGESRRQRLNEYIAANPASRVVCLPESSYIEVKGNGHLYTGTTSGVILSADKVGLVETNQELNSSKN